MTSSTRRALNAPAVIYRAPHERPSVVDFEAVRVASPSSRIVVDATFATVNTAARAASILSFTQRPNTSPVIDVLVSGKRPW